jgi:antitoxin (DNA-binding transcriptional repressor) of toxin-antitoxin stability system
MYIVHVKKVTASEARRHWFRLLDDVAAGEVIVLERKGRRLVLRREEPKKAGQAGRAPAYRHLLRVRDADHADRWSWQWRGGGRLVARRVPAR